MSTEIQKECVAWMETAAQAHKDVGFYRGIITQIGELFGVAAKTSDDGSVQEDVLALKVPELVADLRAKLATIEAERDALKLTIRQLHTQIDAELETGHRVLLKAQALEAEVQKLREAIQRKISDCSVCFGLGIYKATAWGAENPTDQICVSCAELRAALNSNAGDKNTL